MALTLAVLRYRVLSNFAAEAADRTSEDLVQELLDGQAWEPPS